MVFVYIVIAKAKTQADASDPQGSIEQNRCFRYAWSAFTVFLGLALAIMFALIMFAHLLLKDPVLVVILPFSVAAVILLPAIVLIEKIGQGGNRIRVDTSKSGTLINRDDDRYWKLGIFYYNKDDPAMFVEKRFGIGWTSNFAKPLSWLLFFGIVLGLPLLVVFVIILLYST